ncbi:MAG: DUF4422 domain-containing protein [Bacilli bacterium]|nr:DUF4422 domain-containing protein [Bacilli bacterium]
MKDIKVIIAIHKKFKIAQDKMYLPIQVGSEGKRDLGFQKDNEGDNISSKNPYYSELTGLYYAWKNVKADYIGLVHYRRYFTKKINTIKISNRLDKVLTLKEADALLDKTDVILPKKRRYYIENLYSHYKHTMYVEPLDETRKIIQEKTPEYLKEFDKIKKRTSAHMFNMFIMKKEILNEYCEWLFPILEELEKRIPPKNYNSFHARYIGRIAELLFDVWINKNKISYKEVKVINIQRVNWYKKIIAFLKAKYLKEKYTESF